MATGNTEKITNWVAPGDKSGEFKRGQSQFRSFIQRGGEFPPEEGRYHLFVSLSILVWRGEMRCLRLFCLVTEKARRSQLCQESWENGILAQSPLLLSS